MKVKLTILFLFLLQVAFANTIVVGKQKVVSSLPQAVAMAKDGDTILLNKGIYKEGNIIINKSIRLIGVDAPVLDGENKYEILTVSGQNILIKGIHFLNSGYSAVNDFASMKIIDARNVIVENNEVTNGYFAFYFANSVNVIVRENTLKGTPKTEQTSGNGIHLWKCDNMLLEDNEIQGYRDGIYFEFVTNTVIQNNLSTRNIRYGMHFMFSHDNAYLSNIFRDNGAGIAVMFSQHILMLKNRFEKNWGPSAYGILLKEINDSRIIHNHFEQNTVGIFMEGSNRIDVAQNIFKGNGWALKVQASCSDNNFRLNNFFSNTFDVATNGTMMLNKFYTNYWDKYEGYDLNKDNIGDVPYHPVSMYSMVIEQNPNSVFLLRSFMVSLLDKAEKAIPSLTPENLVDEQPIMKPVRL